MKALIFYTILIFGSVQSACKPNKTLDCIVFIGQSNTSAWGDYSKTSQSFKDEIKSLQNEILYCDRFKNKIRSLYPQRRSSKKYLNLLNFKSNLSFHPVFSFSAKMKNHYKNEKLLIINMTTVGSSLQGIWNPNWDEKKAKQIPREFNNRAKSELKMYDATIDKINFCETYAKSIGYDRINLVGVILLGGEKDSMFEVTTNSYKKTLTQLILKLRSDLSNDKLPFIIQQTNCRLFPFTNKISLDQMEVSKTMDYVEILETRSAIGRQKFTKYSDNIHYDTNGVINLGYGLYEELKPYLIQNGI